MRCIPSKSNIISKSINSFKNLYIEDDVMYSIPNCRVFELRGSIQTIIFNTTSTENLLLTAISSIARSDSYLDVMYSEYLLYVQRLKRGIQKKTFSLFLQHFYRSNPNPNLLFGTDESNEDLADDEKIVKSCKYLSHIQTYQEALIYSQFFKANNDNEFISLHSMIKKKTYPLVCHYDRGIFYILYCKLYTFFVRLMYSFYTLIIRLLHVCYHVCILCIYSNYN